MPPRKKPTSCAIRASTSGATVSIAIQAKAATGSRLIRWLLTWGDGSQIGQDGAPPASIPHVYSANNTYPIRLTVWDSKGGTAWDEVSVGVILYTQPSPGGGVPSDEYNYYCQGGGYGGVGTVRTTDGSLSDVQAKIDASSHGDIVCIPPGNFTWNTNVGITDKDIFILGSGIGSTILNPNGNSHFFYYVVNNVTRGHFRLAHMTLKDGTSTAFISVSTASITAPATGEHRIDHIHFDEPAGFTTAVNHIFGVTYGVVDHCVFDQYGGIVTNHQFGLSGETYAGNMAATIPTGFGTDTFVFYEDNTMTMHNQASTLFLWDSTAGGGRPVFRYNQIYGPAEFYSHWTRGNEIAMTAGEFYNNTWNFRPGDPRPGDGMARFEAGTFLFYNNAFLDCPDQPFMVIDDRRASGSENGSPFLDCDGTAAWDGNAGDPAAPGWPCLGQIGRGWTSSTSLDALVAGTVEQPSDPAYIWNNGEQAGCATGGSCTEMELASASPAAYVKKTTHAINGDVDFVENSGAKPGYSAYTYPHPLTDDLWP